MIISVLTKRNSHHHHQLSLRTQREKNKSYMRAQSSGSQGESFHQESNWLIPLACTFNSLNLKNKFLFFKQSDFGIFLEYPKHCLSPLHEEILGPISVCQYQLSQKRILLQGLESNIESWHLENVYMCYMSQKRREFYLRWKIYFYINSIWVVYCGFYLLTMTAYISGYQLDMGKVCLGLSRSVSCD